MGKEARFTRRAALGCIGGGAALICTETFGFTNVTGSRGVSVSASNDPEGLVGLLINDQVKKNEQELLVEVTNNTNEMLDVTVTLDDCTHGTLFSSDGDSGCSVDLSLNASGSSGETGSVDIEAADGGITVPFTITATSPTLSFEADRETDAVSGGGNTEGAVEISKIHKFRANSTDNDWTIEEVEANSNNENNELEKVQYEVRSDAGDGEMVGSFEESATGDTYSRTGTNNDPAITITPDDGHQITKGADYELTVTAFDDGGNFGSDTDDDKAN